MRIEIFYYYSLGFFLIANLYLILSSRKQMKKITFNAIIFFSVLYPFSAILIYVNQVYADLLSSLLISYYVGLMYHNHLYKNRFNQRQEIGLGLELIIIFLIFEISLLYYYVMDNLSLFEISLLIFINMVNF
ncbi:hypothetical protein GFS03_13015 [Sulfolobus sp. E5-1-F]|uniref:hypothetical protein n=1 Tax=Saccharolobus sp. E5-1-F TaxID=2663019 RepID=UPI001297D981|nr:hypothetical protein [Sulfolobus sp. E5-1-F]QGA55421.1 hypothetical protein GFS03_13015 [Sulfolobus sp. E5-1-F]